MGFRQKKNDGNDEWRQWRKQNAELVEASGLPSAIFDYEDSWLEFLEYGCLLGDPTEWQISELSLKQKATTLRLIWTTPFYWQGLLQTGVFRTLLFDMIQAADNE